MSLPIDVTSVSFNLCLPFRHALKIYFPPPQSGRVLYSCQRILEFKLTSVQSLKQQQQQKNPNCIYVSITSESITLCKLLSASLQIN